VMLMMLEFSINEHELFLLLITILFLVDEQDAVLNTLRLVLLKKL